MPCFRRRWTRHRRRPCRHQRLLSRRRHRCQLRRRRASRYREAGTRCQGTPPRNTPRCRACSRDTRPDSEGKSKSRLSRRSRRRHHRCRRQHRRRCLQSQWCCCLSCSRPPRMRRRRRQLRRRTRTVAKSAISWPLTAKHRPCHHRSPSPRATAGARSGHSCRLTSGIRGIPEKYLPPRIPPSLGAVPHRRRLSPRLIPRRPSPRLIPGSLSQVGLSALARPESGRRPSWSLRGSAEHQPG